jgi:hypothetical protein
MSQTNQNEVFSYQYWYVTDPELAAEMGLHDSEDVYILRKSSVFTNGSKPNVRLNGYDFVSEKAITAIDLKENPESGQAKILNLAFNSPVLIKDYRQFFTLA